MSYAIKVGNLWVRGVGPLGYELGYIPQRFNTREEAERWLYMTKGEVVEYE